MRAGDAVLQLALAHEAARLSTDLDAQGAANALWSVSVLAVTDVGVLLPLAAAAEREYAFRGAEVAEATQLLQAHRALCGAVPSGRLLSDALLERCTAAKRRAA